MTINVRPTTGIVHELLPPLRAFVLTLEVRGIPVPQGDHQAFKVGNRIAITAKNRGPLGAWRTAIAQEARAAMADRTPLPGPVAVRLDFRPAFRPAGHFLPANKRRLVRELRLDAPVNHTGTPDADKLARSALDALTGVVFEDDRQVAQLTVTKRWPAEHEAPGVTVTVTRLEETR